MNIDELLINPEIKKIEAGVSGCGVAVKKWIDGKNVRDVINDIQECQEFFIEDTEYYMYLSEKHYKYIKADIDFIKEETKCTKFITSYQVIGAGPGRADCVIFIPAGSQNQNGIVVLYGV